MGKKVAGTAMGALSGAGTGAAIGALGGPAGIGIGATVGALGGGLAGWFGSGDDDEAAYEQQQSAQRAQSKAAQYNYLNQMQAPVVSDATRRRIAALNDESKASSLVEDPFFQGQRATAVQGGQQALSSVGNAHAAYDTTGGFSNQGSQQDVYDRLSSQLSQLGQKSIELKDQKSQQAATMEQGIADAQTAFQNAQLRARMAIESGDSAAASAALKDAFSAKQAMDAANRQTIGAALGGAAQAAGTFAGANRYTASAPSPLASAGLGAQSTFGVDQPMLPYYQQSGRSYV